MWAMRLGNDGDLEGGCGGVDGDWDELWRGLRCFGSMRLFFRSDVGVLYHGRVEFAR